MLLVFQHNESNSRGYLGISLNEQECREHLQGLVKGNLLDREERDDTLAQLRAKINESGFDATDGLMADIQALEDENIQVQNFRVGEAFAEVILEQEFSCRFYWNELRDARNPSGNKTGADLVGFIKVEGQVLFLFGEVKTSSETANRPPQVMTGSDGIERQLRDLYSNRSKRQILISYLKNKVRLFPEGHPFKVDFDSGLRSYYSNPEDYQLIGVLIRDVKLDERDLSLSYGRLRTRILEPIGLKLLALYLPIQQKDWLNIINELTE
ncbi:hypothetical protein [Cecembia lonarensis]|uniref:Anti-bacteriophage protein A/HamA C-terminal domain-containing protein n=1 Tax=Cecembia lonarensis (strain CCUG 58316 / KCTC 22772 / LW9) TaxID=1225176 RepID=K1KZJ2_CECL9|nr:hypothetical protein [Cecembia lonarensis]EKB49595.1 hypothetical protein B879_01799 [Cecembia lonarensis LW9]